MPSVVEAPVVPDVEEVRAAPGVDDAQLLFREARQRRHRRRIVVVGAVVCSVVCLGITFLVTGGGGHFSGGPPTASSKGPVGGATTQHSPPQSHGRQVPATARPSVCEKGIAVRSPTRREGVLASVLPDRGPSARVSHHRSSGNPRGSVTGSFDDPCRPAPRRRGHSPRACSCPLLRGSPMCWSCVTAGLKYYPRRFVTFGRPNLI